MKPSSSSEWLLLVMAAPVVSQQTMLDRSRRENSKDFVRQWRIEHRTSSPHFARSNGLAESAVKVAKTIVKKAKESKTDVYQALLDHRNTPRMATTLSPAQVLFQHPTRTTTLPHYSPPTATEQSACQKKHTR